MNEQWIQDMRQKMADYQRPAPEVSWEEMDRALTANDARKTRSLWLRNMAAAAAVLLVAGVGYLTLMRNVSEPKQPAVANVDTPQQPMGNDIDKSQDIHEQSLPLPDEAPLRQLAQTISRTLTGSSSNIQSKQDADSVVLAENITAVNMSSADTVNTATKTDEKRPQTVEEKGMPSEQTRRIVYPTDQQQGSFRNNRLTAKVYYSNPMGDKSSSQSFSQNKGMPINQDPGIDWGDFSPNGPDEQTTQIEQRVHHRLPVRFGFSLRYQINNRWSVESGLSYTHLSSEITTIEDKVTTVTEQRLNYIGIPLNVGYDLWQKRHFGLYVMAGGMIEKCLDANPWQLSVNGGVGAEYKVTNSFGFYVEPGLGYYFNDGSDIPTIYKDRPLNFNLSIGLRFHLK
jgi:hypothetical protein